MASRFIEIQTSKSIEVFDDKRVYANPAFAVVFDEGAALHKQLVDRVRFQRGFFALELHFGELLEPVVEFVDRSDSGGGCPRAGQSAARRPCAIGSSHSAWPLWKRAVSHWPWWRLYSRPRRHGAKRRRFFSISKRNASLPITPSSTRSLTIFSTVLYPGGAPPFPGRRL